MERNLLGLNFEIFKLHNLKKENVENGYIN